MSQPNRPQTLSIESRRGLRVLMRAGIMAMAMWACSAFSQTVSQVPILSGIKLGKGFNIGLNTSSGLTNWLSTEGAADLLMQYPSGQVFGSVFVTVGPAVPPGNRPGMDMSVYQSLVLELNGDAGTTVAVGIKDSSQPDDGTETTLPLTLSGTWQTYTIPLAAFAGVNLMRVYVATEFVFTGSQSQTVRVRNIVYTSAPPTTTKVLPKFTFGGGWYSAVYLANTGGTTASFQVNFFGQDGNPLNVPSVGGTSTSMSLPPRGTAIIEAPNAGGLTQGYVSISLPSFVTGYGILRQSVQGNPDQEAEIPFSGSSAMTTTLVYDDTTYQTAVAIVNPGSTKSTVTITIRDPSGLIVGTTLLAMAANSQTEVVLRNLPGLAAIAGNRGSADFSVDAGSVAVLGLRSNGPAFTSLPTIDR